MKFDLSNVEQKDLVNLEIKVGGVYKLGTQVNLLIVVHIHKWKWQTKIQRAFHCINVDNNGDVIGVMVMTEDEFENARMVGHVQFAPMKVDPILPHTPTKYCQTCLLP